MGLHVAHEFVEFVISKWLKGKDLCVVYEVAVLIFVSKVGPACEQWTQVIV